MQVSDQHRAPADLPRTISFRLVVGLDFEWSQRPNLGSNPRRLAHTNPQGICRRLTVAYMKYRFEIHAELLRRIKKI